MKQLIRLVLWPAIAGLAIAAIILQFFSEQLPQPPEPSTPDKQSLTASHQSFSGPFSYSDAVKKAAPAVVNIYTAKIVRQRVHPLFKDPFFQRFLNRGNIPKRERMQSSLGSGVIIGADGYVVTNNHVIAGADEIVVALQDGRESFAKVVGSDPETDLAVLKINIAELPVITLAPSENIEVGDVALAIGNPFGVGQTVTMGIISATGRNLGLNPFEDFIQTDAAVNPGNSGGALVNPNGDLIGINTAIFSKSGGSHGIGFAIPSQLASKILEDIIEYGSVVRGWLGVEGQKLTPALARSFGLSEIKGVLIVEVYRNGPAHLAGLQPGDIILEIAGELLLSPDQVMNRITASKPGETIDLKVLRNGQELQISAVVGKRVPQANSANSRNRQ